MPPTKPVSTRLVHQSRSWQNDIPSKFLWTVNFSSRTQTGKMVDVGANITKVLNEYESNSWAFDEGLFDYRTQDSLGYLFAQEVALPQEQLNIGVQPIQGSGGFIAGYFGERRLDYGSGNKLDITFLEQNKDIVDLFIRPWVVAVSYFGLIEDDETDLKCNIDINLHSNSAEDNKQDFTDISTIRKRYSFEGCVPYQLQPDKVSYGDLSESDLMRTVAFTFSRYKIEDGYIEKSN